MKKTQNRQTLRKVLQYIGNYRYLLLLVLFLSLLSVLGTLYLPIEIGRAIDCIVKKGEVDFEKLAGILVKIGVLVCLTALFQWLMSVLSNRITFGVVHDLRQKAFSRLADLPLSYLDKETPGSVVSRVISDADTLSDGLLMGFTQLFTGVITILGTLVFMLTIHPLIAIPVIVLTPLSLLVSRFIAKRSYAMFRLQASTRAEQTAFIDEMIGNQKTVRAFRHENENQKKFDEINDRLEKASLRAIFFSSLTNPSTRFVNALVYASVAFCGAFAVIKDPVSFTVGNLTSFLSYANQYTKPFNNVSSVVTELQNALACADRLFELIELPAEENGGETLGPASGRIDLDNVDFSYVPGQKLIEDLDLHVKPGQKIAIVGPTGCGKTTLINLLMRFYDVTGGVVSVDGVDVKKVTRQSLRRNYGMVLQETWLKTGTIRENILMGKPDASDDEMIAAAKACRAHSFISRLKDGYDTVIGEDGGVLSEGQKQLLCVTRILLSLPPMLILDEATSSIDTLTELNVRRAFDRLTDGRTSFIVAHRLSTIRTADLILVMKSGQIVERGTHEELLRKNGFYAELYNSQFAK